MSSIINWNDPKSKISKYFTVGEATWLPRLKLYYSPSETEKQAIIDLADKLDLFREYLNSPIIVNVWIRPVTKDKTGKDVDYNALVGGAKNSSHKVGQAVDFMVKGYSAEQVRQKVKDKLPEWGLYMEDDVTWCHAQSRPTASGSHIFKP